MNHPFDPTPAHNLATMRQSLHSAALATIIERRPRRPLPTPRRQGPLPRYGFVIALVAAHDAEHRLPATLESLDAQTRRPDAVVVVADRCTDATVVTALVHGATVVETNGNHHGCGGALDLALTEVLAMVDDEDAVVIVGDGVTLTPTFVAAGLAELWSTPEPPTRWRPSRRPVGLVTAVPGPLPTPGAGRVSQLTTSAGKPTGVGWPGAASPGGGATMTLAGALREVADARRDDRLGDPGRTGGVLDPTAVDPEAELAVALAGLGRRSTAPKRCGASRSGSTPPTPRDLFEMRRRTQHATLTALVAHRRSRSTHRLAMDQGRLALEVVGPILATATLAGMVLTDAPSLLLTVVLAVATTTWILDRSWAARHTGRHLPAELLRGLARSVAAGMGVVVGSWHWLTQLRCRRKVWRHPTSGRVLARRPAPFPSFASPAPPALSLVRVPGAAIAIERTSPPPHATAERWRRRALGACMLAIALVVVVGLPLLLPIPLAVLVGVWALATTVVSATRLTRSFGMRRD